MSDEQIYKTPKFQNYDNNDVTKSKNVNDSMAIINTEKRRSRKAVFRRTIDYNSPVQLFIEQRAWKRKCSTRNVIQPDVIYQHLMTPSMDYRDNPMNAICAKHVRTSTNKNKYPIYVACWTPDGRRLITGSASGEFTLWNGLTFNFETILQAHDSNIRAMEWSNNEEWMVSADDAGFVKYWQGNMNDVNVFQAHKDSVRGISYAPSDKKFATCSVDNTVRLWDFQTCKEERVLRGHGSDVVCVNWHPTKSLLLSGSKDCQKPLNLWDPKSGDCISTMYVHKSTCTDIQINRNGNWFLTASKDHYVKLFDLRFLKKEMQVFRGHKKEVNRVAWHTFHENLFVSGSGDGSLLYWLVGVDLEVGSVENAHDNIVWTMDWHPLGHILASGSNDFTTKFWARNQPGDILVNNNLPDPAKTEPSYEKNPVDDSYEINSETPNDNCKLEMYNIPGLSENIHISSDVIEDDFENNEFDSKELINRVIPKQFSDNWEKNISIPVVKLESVLKNNVQPNVLQNIQPPVPMFSFVTPNCKNVVPNQNLHNFPIKEEPPQMLACAFQNSRNIAPNPFIFPIKKEPPQILPFTNQNIRNIAPNPYNFPIKEVPSQILPFSNQNSRNIAFNFPIKEEPFYAMKENVFCSRQPAMNFHNNKNCSNPNVQAFINPPHPFQNYQTQPFPMGNQINGNQRFIFQQNQHQKFNNRGKIIHNPPLRNNFFSKF